MSQANKIRNWVNKNSAIVTILAVVVLIMALGIIVISQRTPTYRPVDVYYYDLNTGELFTALSTEIPPIEAPSGPVEGSNGFPAGVRAYVYSCSECSDAESRFIGWLEMYTPEVKKRLENPQDFEDDPDAMMEMDAMGMYEEGHLVRAMDKQSWVPATSEEGFMIVQEVQERCGEGAIPQPCLPDS